MIRAASELRRRPLAAALAACLAVALLSLLGPSVPNADPWGWIIWGRQLDHGSLVTIGYPSWKPLPALISALSGLGGAGPEGWVVAVRAGGLAALVFAYRLAAREAGWVAGVAAAAGVALFPHWIQYLAHGTSEPLLLALVLGALDAHALGRRRLALGAGAVAALIRPEVWPFLLAYAWWAEAPGRSRRVALAIIAVGLPALWLVPDWIGSGDLFHGPALARRSHEAGQTRESGQPVLYALQRGGELLAVPIGLWALAAVALAWRRRDRPVLLLTGLALGWTAIVLTLTTLGWAGIARFLEPAGALVCVLGGIGLARMTVTPPARPLLAGLAVGALALGAPSVIGRVRALGDDGAEVTARADMQRRLATMVTALGGPRAIAACDRVSASAPWRTALAWELDLSTDHVASLRPPVLVFRTRDDEAIRARTARLVLASGDWEVLALGRLRCADALARRVARQRVARAAS